MKKVLTILAMSSVVLTSGFANNASAQIEPISQEDSTRETLLVQPSSIYENAIIVEPFTETIDKTTKYTTTKFYKVKYDYLGSGPLIFNMFSEYGNHELYVYDEKYLSVGTQNSMKDLVTVNNPKVNAWYYIEVRQLASTLRESPFKMSTGW